MAQTIAAGHTLLGVYEVIRPLGEGGMGCVYLARQRTTGKDVVVKLIHEHLAADAGARQSFAREVQVLRRFRHRHAVALIDAHVDGTERPCVVMEHIDGISLGQVLDQQRLRPWHVGRLLAQLASVLQAAHDRNILHRDLTPANMMVIDFSGPREMLKVMDFGLAHSGGFYISLEQLQGAPGGLGGGTPDYVCPEQLRGEEVDQRGDLYSVGVTLYELLTGHRPFETAQEIEDILDAHLKQDPPRFADFGVTLSPKIEGVIRKCLAKQPRDRYPTARALAEAFQEALGQPILTPETFAPTGDEQAPPYDPAALLDRFEAWMPEQVAIVKLRGFVDGVGGTVVESLPGLIKVHLPGPRPAQQARSGLFNLFRNSPAPSAPIPIELHLQKRLVDGRGLVEVAVVHPPAPSPDAADRKAVCSRVCNELRAYLMIGR